jgi:hypothetical protein
MSLAIEVDDVVAVLLRDGWHAVADDSFEIDSYEFLHGDVVRVGGGVVQGGKNKVESGLPVHSHRFLR